MPAANRWFLLLREPLLQFVLIGGVLFALDSYFSASRDDPKHIYVDSERVNWLVSVFKEGQGRLPEPQEVENLIVKWSQNEVFYREAQALGLDQGDDMMRSRLILKMRNILFNRIIQQPPSESEVRDWFELNRHKYDTPERYSFEQFPVPESDQQQAQALAQQLQGQPVPGDSQAQLRQYQRRPAANIQALFGQPGRAALVASEINQWQAVQSQKGWHLARITQRHAAMPAQFEHVKSRVQKAFMEVSADMQLVEMASEISEKYQIHREFSQQDLTQLLVEVERKPALDATADSRALKARAGTAKRQFG